MVIQIKIITHLMISINNFVVVKTKLLKYIGIITFTFLCACSKERNFYIDDEYKFWNKYYLRYGMMDDSPGGVFDGTVSRISVAEDFIYADVKRLYHGDPNGIYKVDRKTGIVSGPIEFNDNLIWHEPSVFIEKRGNKIQ